MNGSLYLWKLFSFFFFFAMFLFSRILRKAFKARSFGNGRSFFFLWIFAFESAAGFLFCFFLFMFMFLSFFLGIPGSPAFFFSFGALESLDCLPGAVFFLWSSLLAHTSVGCWFFFFFLAGSRMGIGMGQLSLTIDLWFSTRYSPSSSTYLCNDPCETTSFDLAVSSGINVSRQCGYGNRWSLDRL